MSTLCPEEHFICGGAPGQLLLGESYCWETIMIFAEDHDLGRG